MNLGRDLGKRGEEIAVHFLKKNHYKIIEKNFRCKFGEIDIIAVEDQTLVFIEVKARSSLEYGIPQMSITAKKRQQLLKVALYYLQINKLFNRDARFDVVAVEVGAEKSRIELIRNAFEISK
ncbi:MAG: YraN family protein [Desulfobacterota bacterium]|nr:YraN family protein [Thermodesulfobacteriota bacterium]